MKLERLLLRTIFAAFLTVVIQVLPPLFSSAQALACGGFFCSSLNLVPIEQNAERILFEVNKSGKSEGTVTVTVDISYTGSPGDFSWVLPVSDLVGELSVAPPQALLLLEDATAPSIIPPPTRCTEAFPSPFGGSLTSFRSDSALDNGVVVDDLEQVGPYAPQLVSSEDAGALIAWLNDNDYLITVEMEPAVADYVADGMKFLAMKLAPGAGVADIAPIQVTYPGDEPMVPLVLTSVGAEPEMGVLVFIAAESRYESANYANLQIDTDLVQVNPRNGMDNYYPLLSWQIDQRGGEAMVTEFVDSSDSVSTTASNNWSWNEDFAESLAFLAELSERQPFITRMYTRVSAWEMNSDPAFEEQGGALVSRVHDLSDRAEVEVCRGEVDAVACGSMYCGVGAECATTEAGDACACPPGTAARVVSAPRLQTSFASTTVFCQDTTFDLMASLAEMAGTGSGVDPCSSFTCGSDGQCLALNGFATCLCDDGFAAVPDGASGMTCAAVMKTYGPEQLLWNTSSGCGCSSAGSAPSLNWLVTLSLFLLPLVARRRRS